MNAFVDIHHHLLFGLDDGPADRSGMERMLEAAYRESVREIVATPHIVPGVIPFDRETILEKVDAARQCCRALGLEMRILPGAETMYTFHTPRYLLEKQIPTLADTDKVLVEFTANVRYAALEEAVRAILHTGFLPVLAHIERYPCLMRSPQRALSLRKRYDVLYQINGSSLAGIRDPIAGHTVRCLLSAGEIDHVASDAHDAGRRRCCFLAPYERLVRMVGRPYADALTGNGMKAEDVLDS